MINLALSLLSGILVFVGFYFGWLPVWWQALPPALLVGVGAYVMLSRRTWKQLEAHIKHSLSVLEPMQNRPDIAQRTEQRNALLDEAIKKLKESYKYASWQFLVRSQVDAQIGILLFSMKQDINAAQPYLENSFSRNWIAQAMLGVVYMKKHKPEKMEETFEMAVRLNKKQDLLWQTYAYCLQKIKQRDKAIEVLGRACKVLPNNNQLTNNLVALQNKKKMKMKQYGEQWYQFGLEKPQQQKTMKPRFSRR
ncbi:MAG TPA: hypothetical protein DCE42_11630 [Myxococcales bacterium]|nr:hypothetical protein [Deltaproteobacteria bacterium]HAA55401.1 hypothetical protein [Myxococcales bacterium]|tara:strand:- start:11729 stop:12481 length:753 start_codon:yes stop_codon:yes gene_type:complete